MTALIDVHAHILPDVYRQSLQAHGILNIDGFPTPDWSVAAHLKMMDAHDIAACVVSLSAPGLEFMDAGEAVRMSRAINEIFGAMIREHPARFGAFALLPLPNVDTALEEIAYALDILKLDGVGLYSNYGGKYPGHPDFAPVLDELERRKVVVFVHPRRAQGAEESPFGYSAAMLEYPFDTTRMVVSLLHPDTLGRCGHVRFIATHGGGTLPFLASRIANLMAGTDAGNPVSMLVRKHHLKEEIGSLYFDLTAATNESALAAIRASHRPARLLMGFDFPFMPAMTINPATKEVAGCEGFTEGEQEAIRGGNALELFPRLAAAIEAAP